MDSTKFYIIIPVLLLGLAACGRGGGNGAAQDPLVTGFPIAYVKRPFPLLDTENNNQVLQPDARDPLIFNPGSDLYIRDHASAQAEPRNITSAVTRGAGDIKDVKVSYDAKKLLFALKQPDIEGREPEEQPSWNIWEYNIETGKLRRIIQQDIFAEEGQDVMPDFLPDGRIIFSSSRQAGSKKTLANEGKPRYRSLVDGGEQKHAMMLHVMNDDGTDIRQITYAPVIDMDPYVRRDGKVVFTRWDRSSVSNAINIYSINPDGTYLQLLYGAHSHDSGPNNSSMQYTQLREYPDGRVFSILRPFSDTYGGGDISLIDTEHFADYGRPTRRNAGLTGTGQASLTGGSASAELPPSMGGRYISAFPLWDGTGRSLVSWTPCRIMVSDQSAPCTAEGLLNPDVVEAPPIYSLYIYDPVQNTKLPIFLPEAGMAITDVIAAQPRAYPGLLEDKVETTSEKTGILHIRSVYDYDGGFDSRGVTGKGNTLNDFLINSQPTDRRARFIRLIKNFVRPDRNDYQIPNLANRGGALVEIIGYAPIEPDGSVKVRVPADVPFSFQIVDINGRRINEQRHISWIQIRKGETLECNGCHRHNSGTPHGRRDAITSINPGVDNSGVFPGQGGALPAQAGETMAETRTRISCQVDNCKGLNPTVDIVYEDLWSTTKSPSFAYQYDDIFNFTDTETDPVSHACVLGWTKECRVIINYVTHIDPLWSKPRLLADEVTDKTCSQAGCHSPVDKAGLPQVPAPSIAFDPPSGPPCTQPATTGSQLNLDNISLFDQDDDPARLEAYTELFNSDNVQQLVDGSLVDAVFDGAPIFNENNPEIIIGCEQTTITTRPGPPMSAGSARTSRFFNVFVESNATHYDSVKKQPILSPSELKLISEWLDIGGQYYNDPFAVPPN